MKKVIRLTENDLVRIVKRVISEQPQTDKIKFGWRFDENGNGGGVSKQECYQNTPGKYKNIIRILDQSNALNMGNFANWDEDGIKKAFMMINSQSELVELNNNLNCFFGSELHEPRTELFNWAEWVLNSAFSKVSDFMDKDIYQSIKGHFKSKGINIYSSNLGNRGRSNLK
jgi:hypothetical protein